jgi:hypothetical protein
VQAPGAIAVVVAAAAAAVKLLLPAMPLLPGSAWSLLLLLATVGPIPIFMNSPLPPAEPTLKLLPDGECAPSATLPMIIPLPVPLRNTTHHAGKQQHMQNSNSVLTSYSCLSSHHLQQHTP